MTKEVEDLHTEIQDTSEETAEDKRTAISKCQEIKSLEGYEEKGTLVHCQWKLVQPLWKTVYSRCCSVFSCVRLFVTHGLKHARLPCLPSPGVCSNSCPLCQ